MSNHGWMDEGEVGMNDWLNNLKRGDTVVALSGHYGKDVERVARITPTQIVLESGDKYSKYTGSFIGYNAGAPKSITEPTERLVNEIRKTELCAKLRQIVWEKVDVGTLADVFDKVKNGQHIK